MADLIWSPLITKWPKPATQRPKSAEWSLEKSQRKLSWELDQLEVREARIEVDAAPGDFRKLDGALYKDARLRSSKVLVVFHLPEVGEVQYACDQYHRWQQNLHAIALTLERLRLIDGYGATVAGSRQQYRGFKRLGSGGEEESHEVALNPMEAAELVLRFVMGQLDEPIKAALVRVILEDAEQMRLYVRKAERQTHPDQGGRADQFANVQRAKAVLQTHHGAQEAAAPG